MVNAKTIKPATSRTNREYSAPWRRTTDHSFGQSESRWRPRIPPSPQRNTSPDCFHQSERPSALQEAVRRPQPTRHGERQDEPRASVLECVAHEHCCDREEAEGREDRHARSIIASRNCWEPGGPVTSSTTGPAAGSTVS